MAKLIVVVAFDHSKAGSVQPAFGPTEERSEECAIHTARDLATKYPDVVAWSRDIDAAGGIGEPKVLFRSGGLQRLQ